jgi:hypothetical protein
MALPMTVNEVLKHHLMVFAAEKSRKESLVVDCLAFEREVREMHTN